MKKIGIAVISGVYNAIKTGAENSRSIDHSHREGVSKYG